MSEVKKLDLPKIIVILGDRFSVRQQPDLRDTDELTALDGDQTGYKLRINADNDSSKKWRTLLHESTHGALYVTGIQSGLDPDMEEVIVQTMETHVVQFMRAHGEVFLAAIKSDT